MSSLLNRKDLPRFGYLKHAFFPVEEVIETCKRLGLLDFCNYKDIQASSGSEMEAFVRANQYSKNSFFKEDGAVSLEGDLYKQKYLTKIRSEIHFQEKFTSPVFSRGKRQMRLDPNSKSYNPFVDEMNYGERTELVQGAFERILDSFESSVKRVRLAVLAPHFAIKPHTDYDASYIVRYHYPIITNDRCFMHTWRGGHEQRAHFPADGKIYFLNAGLKHCASNGSDCERLHLIIDVHGQSELKNLCTIESEDVFKAENC